MMDQSPLVQFHHLKQLSYKDVWDYQHSLQQKLIHHKREIKLSEGKMPVLVPTGHLIFCEHKPVYTLGKSGSLDHLLLNETQLAEKQIEYFKINRGGDITYHGPGQITGYLILDLDQYYHDVHRFVREIEESIIRFLAMFGIEGNRLEGYTGVWVQNEKQWHKICAIGIHMSRWVSLHGFALNVCTDLQYFQNIIPCGIEEENLKVGSVSSLLSKKVEPDEVIEKLQSSFKEIFGFEIIKPK